MRFTSTSPLVLTNPSFGKNCASRLPSPGAIDIETRPGDARALDRLGAETALRHGVLPLLPAGSITPVAAQSVGAFRQAEPALSKTLGQVCCCLADRAKIEGEIARLRDTTLAANAAVSTAKSESCRGWSGLRTAAITFAATFVLAVLAVLWPAALFWALTIWATLTLLAVTGLRTLAAMSEALHARRSGQVWTSNRPLQRSESEQPVVSLLVPLFDEDAIADRLLARLDRIDYPRSRLDVILILEADDTRTRTALDSAELQDWMRIVTVPSGPVRTKPRAMNYALDFARGEIVGIYDAEDAPAADQILRVVETFRHAGPEVACVQGVLDFYNASQNWLTRCFAIDYATWFRLVLPGLVRLGFAIPLGGTTLFFRRDVLDKLGRWDAHNVTEDADLGLRLARRGYRTAFLHSVTEEEATASIPAWLRQRSRWIKGYAVTWAVHMRDPLRLLGELGPKRFLGMQILFLGTLSQFILAPLLWSYWLILFGLAHPITSLAPWPVVVTFAGLFLISEIATLAVAALSVATPKRRWLIKWVPMMHLYFPLAAIASWKGYAELVSKPFFWDKTAHGRMFTPRPEDPAAPLHPHPV